jgi:hypothetical protein
LLADGRRFRGAIAEIPADADDGAPAATCTEPAPATIGPGEPAADGFERAKENPQRRVVVVDEDENLLGLLCLKASLTGFCGRPSRG